MQHGAHIGPSVIVKGEISAKEPLTVSGRVEGNIDVSGHAVTIESGAHVTANVTAAEIVVAGTVTGSLNAEERITLRTGADVKGNLNAPRLTMDEGARVRGKADIVGSRALNLARAS